MTKWKIKIAIFAPLSAEPAEYMKKWSIGLILCFTGAQTMVKFYFQPASINWCETLKIWLFKAEIGGGKTKNIREKFQIQSSE